jgi:hypothetical protein
MFDQIYLGNYIFWNPKYVFSPYGDCLLVPFTLNNFVYNEVLINMNEQWKCHVTNLEQIPIDKRCMG